MSRLLRLTWMPAMLVLLSPDVKASTIYTIADLGTLPGTNQSIATGINDLGQVVGYANNSAGAGIGPIAGSQSFLYSNGQLTPINDPVSGLPAGAINNSGQVAGIGQFINNSGQVASSYQPFQVPVNTTSNGVSTTIQETFTPAGINDAGQIAGNLRMTGGATEATIYQSGKVFDIGKALGLTGEPTVALAINRAGDVLLYDFHPKLDGATYLIYKADGTSQVLTMGGPAVAMNNLGQVVGSGSLFSNGQSTPLSYLIPPSSQSLWQFLNPTAINDAGQIVGDGKIDGQIHAFLMTPTATPEPSALALLATAFASFGLREWVRRRSP